MITFSCLFKQAISLPYFPSLSTAHQLDSVEAKMVLRYTVLLAVFFSDGYLLFTYGRKFCHCEKCKIRI